MKNNINIQTRLSLSFGLLFAVSFFFVGYIHIWGLPWGIFHGLIDIQRAESFRELNRVADHKKEHLQYWIRDRRADIHMFAHNQFVRPGVQRLIEIRDTIQATESDPVKVRIQLRQSAEYKELKTYLLAIKNNYGYYRGLHISDALTGQFLVATYDQDPATDKFYSSPANSHLMRGNDYVEPVILGHHSKTPVIHVIHPVTDSSETVVAILKMGININDAVIPLLNTGKGLGESGESFLVNSSSETLGAIRYPLADGNQLRPLRDMLHSEAVERAVAGRNGIVECDDYRGEPVLAAYRFIEMTPEWGWGLVVKRDQKELYASLRHNVWGQS